MDSQHYEGKGCICFARSQGDCACDADWTPKEVYTLRKRVAELEKALLWSRDSNTGFEPSVSVMHRYYDELLPKGGVADD
jgi:hypothetical protein